MDCNIPFELFKILKKVGIAAIWQEILRFESIQVGAGSVVYHKDYAERDTQCINNLLIFAFN
jgi:hypothetical protein